MVKQVMDMNDTKKRALVLYNSNAGTGSSAEDLMKAIEYLTLNHIEVTIYPIMPSEGLVSETILDENHDRFDLAIVCGGDGTLNHAINGILKDNIHMPIGYVPVGSTNDFSKSLYGNHGHSILDVCHYIVNGKTFTYDAGKFNDSYFNYVAGFGAFPMVSYTTPQNMKNSLGYTAYILKLISAIPEGLSFNRHCIVEHDGITEEGNYMFGLITNSVSVGGVQPGLIKKSSLNDGIFEVTMVKANLNPVQIANVLNALNSDSPHSDSVTTFQMKHGKFTFDSEVPWTLDGEDGGNEKDIVIDVVPDAVTIFSPEE
jgi:YegS/Rv2252/BmrU family lipid kinase